MTGRYRDEFGPIFTFRLFVSGLCSHVTTRPHFSAPFHKLRHELFQRGHERPRYERELPHYHPFRRPYPPAPKTDVEGPKVFDHNGKQGA